MIRAPVPHDVVSLLLEPRRYSARIKAALTLIFCDGVNATVAAQRTGASYGVLLRRIPEFQTTLEQWLKQAREMEELRRRQCPPGWHQTTVVYPPAMEADVVALLTKVDRFTRPSLEVVSNRKKPANTGGKGREKGVKKGVI